ncbi:MAG: efflux RND transporter periplasmic adaptor subunit [Bradymonadaceae bacterium]|nr:efflux RND transporter periplasmic adaptor subunit [Lujinxingiaceae bacterium]
MVSIRDLKIESPAPKEAASGNGRRLGLNFALGAALAIAIGLNFVERPGIAPLLQPDSESSADGAHVSPAESRSAESRPAQAPAGAFSAAGYLEIIPPGPQIVSTMVEARVDHVGVVEGQIVEAGQELARLDDALFRRDAEIQQSKVALARAQLARLKAGFRPEEISTAKAELEQAQARHRGTQKEHERNQQLLEKKAIAQGTTDASLAEMEGAAAQVAARQAELQLRQRGARPEEIAAAQAEIAVAEAEAERALWKQQACIITAPIAGVVLEVFVGPGDWISTSERDARPGALLSIFDPSRIQAWVDVNQRDIGRVTVGQEVLLTSDAAPDQPFEGRVQRLLPRANLQRNTVQVKIEIPNPPDNLRPEMSVKASFQP